MGQRIGAITLVVTDYDEAIAYYTEVLGFVVVKDQAVSPGKRWVVVRPKGTEGTALLLAKAANSTQASRVGDQTGGRVFLFLFTDDFSTDYRTFSGRESFSRRSRERSPTERWRFFETYMETAGDLIEPGTSDSR